MEILRAIDGVFTNYRANFYGLSDEFFLFRYRLKIRTTSRLNSPMAAEAAHRVRGLFCE